MGDFPLQTDYLAAFKQRQLLGVVLHTLVLTLAAVMLTLSTWQTTLAVALVTFGTHTFIDWYKIYLAKTYNINGLIPFLIDQVLHLILALTLALVFRPAGPFLIPISNSLLLWLNFLTVVVFLVSILVQFVANTYAFQPEIPFITSSEKIIGYLERLLLFCGLWQGSVVFILLSLIPSPAFYYYKWHSWMKLKRFYWKTATSLVVTIILSFCFKILS